MSHVNITFDSAVMTTYLYKDLTRNAVTLKNPDVDFHQYLWLGQTIELCLGVGLFTRNPRRIQNTANYLGWSLLQKQLLSIFAKSFILGAIYMRAGTGK